MGLQFLGCSTTVVIGCFGPGQDFDSGGGHGVPDGLEKKLPFLCRGLCSSCNPGLCIYLYLGGYLSVN